MGLIRVGGMSVLLLWSALGLTAAGGDARLLDAVKAGNRPALQALLKAGAPVNAAETDGTTALHWAVRANDLETARVLIRAGANVKAANRYGMTPLGLAAVNGSAMLIEALLKAGADPNAALLEGETVLMTAARTGNPEALTLLLAHGANVNQKENGLGETALMWAASENHAAAVRVLIERGADLNARSAVQETPSLIYPRTGFDKTNLQRGGWTPLMYAARQGALDAAKSLALAGADVNLVDPDGTTALVLAIINAHYEVATTLLDRGADPNIADQTGMAPLYAAVDMRTLPWIMGRPDPKPSSELSTLDVVKALLGHGANPNAELRAPILRRQHTDGDPSLGKGSTPFMRAAKSGDVAAMKLLVERGADPARTQANGTNALMLAAGMGWRNSDDVRDRAAEPALVEALKLCLELGADINGANESGDTALHGAAVRGLDAIVRFLAGRGAKLDAKNAQGRTPLDVALRGRGGRGAQTAVLLRQLMGEGTTGATAQPR